MRTRPSGRAAPIPIERCADGAGNIAFALQLLGGGSGAPVAEIVTIGTSYRSHRDHCAGAPAPAAAHSARSFDRKTAR